MNNKNILFNCTLEQYNKKYRNRRHRLVKYTKKQVEDFDKQYGRYIFNNKSYSLEYNHYLLKGRKWTLIGDTYYEIPKPVRLTWLRNLNVGVQVAMCLLGAATVASSVVFPTLSVTIWNKGGKPIGPEPVKEWYEDQSYINNLTEEDVTKGTVKEVIVNNQVHKVRLIGIDHDVDANGNKIHTTWEFANLISDNQGCSLAYQWNDTNDDAYNGTANKDYVNSSIRYALTGSGDNNKHGSKILAAQGGATTWSTDYKDKKIIDMLPSSLVNNLKTVKKTAGTTNTYDETSYTDKLFMLSSIELGYDEKYDKGFGTTYLYYNGHKEAADAIRIKKQVNDNGPFRNSCFISSDSGQAYQKGNVNSYAGYQVNIEGTGGYYWFRSPSSFHARLACFCNRDGRVSYSGTVFGEAYSVAPAFCL